MSQVGGVDMTAKIKRKRKRNKNDKNICVQKSVADIYSDI